MFYDVRQGNRLGGGRKKADKVGGWDRVQSIPFFLGTVSVNTEKILTNTD
jgi:hypothetical protein